MDQYTSFVAHGHIRQDGNGRIIIDTCESDSWHLRFATTDPGTNKPTCRHAPDIVFRDLIGKTGRLIVSVRFAEDNHDC